MAGPHSLAVLAAADRVEPLTDLMLTQTSTIGVRQTEVRRPALERTWTTVDVPGRYVRIKVASRNGEIVHATPELEEVAAVAAELGLPVRQVLEQATAALVSGGLVPGAPAPSSHDHDLSNRAEGPLSGLQDGFRQSDSRTGGGSPRGRAAGRRADATNALKALRH